MINFGQKLNVNELNIKKNSSKFNLKFNQNKN